MASFKSPMGDRSSVSETVKRGVSETRVAPGLFPLQLNTHTPCGDSSVQFENDSILLFKKILLEYG